jgi:glycosyltransferase involved in cell wall biosynthesis
MKLIFVTGREPDYPRNSQILKALTGLHEVIPVQTKATRLSLRLLHLGLRLAFKKFGSAQAVFIGFYGHPLVPLTRWRWKGPLIFDAFVSTYDTLCNDRKLFKPGSPFGRLALRLDRLSCHLADAVIVDTRAQAAYFEKNLDVPPTKLQVIYVGCDEQLFKPLSVSNPSKPTVLFYGTFLPLHGIETILKAAKALDGQGFHFRLIGKGQEYESARRLVSVMALKNIEFIDPVPLVRLPAIIAESTLCLGGHFGASEKAGRVIAGKTFQCLACAKPTIVGDNPANRELFTHARDVWMIPMADPLALAKAIEQLIASPRLCSDLGRNGRDLVVRTCGNRQTQERIRDVLTQTMAQHGHHLSKIAP